MYYRPDPARWASLPLRPPAGAADQAGSFERAAGRLRERGLRVAAWAVLTHGCRPDARPTLCVRNAYGDRYPWALCPGSAAVRDYATSLAAEVAALGEADEIELEACGWYGIDHGGAHDKTGGAAADPAARWLLSLCFCPACADGYARAGADPGELRAAVAAALDAALGWGPAGADSRLPGGDGFHVEVVYAITPSTATSTFDFWAVARDFALGDTGVSAFLYDSNRTVVLQDVEALNRLEQVVAAEPPGLQELSINIDTGGLAARRLLARLAEESAGLAVPLS